MYAVLPKLPEDLETATVKVAGKVFPHVPIEDGAMTPEKPRNGPILVGKGWPKADPARIDKVKDQGQFVYPVSKNSTILDSAVATRDEGSQTRIDIAADVLFDFDKATLTGKAKQEIKTAADQIRKAKPKGTITITGHTDSDGADGYNQKLSDAVPNPSPRRSSPSCRRESTSPPTARARTSPSPPTTPTRARPRTAA